MDIVNFAAYTRKYLFIRISNYAVTCQKIFHIEHIRYEYETQGLPKLK